MQGECWQQMHWDCPKLTTLAVGQVQTREEMATLLEQGSLLRATGSTGMNRHSSRSHAIFTITVEQRRLAPEPAGAAPSGPSWPCSTDWFWSVCTCPHVLTGPQARLCLCFGPLRVLCCGAAVQLCPATLQLLMDASLGTCSRSASCGQGQDKILPACLICLSRHVFA